MNPQTEQVDDLQLIALPNAVSCADLFVRFALSEWALRPMIGEAGEVVRHLVEAAVERATPGNPSFITVRLRLTGGYLVVEVEDAQAMRAPATPPGLAGRRTGVVDLAGRGSLIWCELALPAGMTASAVPLPRRERRRSPAAEQLGDESAEIDPAVMQRILYGLNGAPEQ
ncbi:ATP-binding protein [Umezawaea beigongshangensis]|uniref:ATP-binding protein n=1 Tax=Umezawaea beigongshangensis TaxID=2780383 RepID=UPI0018F143E9|nr:ATP-binding protein [Umezawaea beigongshangensis]